VREDDAALPLPDSIRLVTLWAAEWRDGRVSVFTSSGAPAAREEARRRLGRGDGWPAVGAHREDAAIRRVLFLELVVAPKAARNAPEFGRLRFEEDELSWLGPHSTVAGSRPRDTGRGLARPVLSERYRLWSYVWCPSQLVLFTAPDFCSASSWASEAPYGGPYVQGDVEPVEDIEVQLAPDDDGLAPTCYRVWIEGHKVGWPAPRPGSPRPGKPPPGSPLPAEARLPIPTYVRTKAKAPGEVDPRRVPIRRWPAAR